MRMPVTVYWKCNMSIQLSGVARFAPDLLCPESLSLSVKAGKIWA